MGLLDLFLSRKETKHLSDIEKAQSQGRPSVSIAPVEPGATPAPLSPDDRLAAFRMLVGITTHSSMLTSSLRPSTSGRPATNVGIYQRVIRNENTSKKGFKIFSYLINGCLILQIVIAASLTAMGAANSNHNAVTAFGAINTIIAGVLTFLKGSGLPNRLKYYQQEWKRVRELIEQRERDFLRPGCELDVLAVVDGVERMYLEIKSDIAANTPDAYVSVTHMGKRTRGGDLSSTLIPGISKGDKHGSALNKEVEDIRSDLPDKLDKYYHLAADRSSKLSGLASEGASHLSSMSEKSGMLSGLKEKAERLSSLSEKAEEAASEFEHKAKEEVERGTRHGEVERGTRHGEVERGTRHGEVIHRATNGEKGADIRVSHHE